MNSKVGMRPLWADLEDLSDEYSSDEAITADQQGSKGHEESNRIDGRETGEGLNARIGKPGRIAAEGIHTSWADMDDSEDGRNLDEDMLLQVPKDADGFPTSVGAIKHTFGTCSPCFFHIKNKCVNGILCSFCHAEHRRKQQIRPSKARHERLRRWIQIIARKVECDSSSDTLDSRVSKCLDSMVHGYESVDLKHKVISYLSQAQMQKN